jgi:hypothetical protein
MESTFIPNLFPLTMQEALMHQALAQWRPGE